MAWKMEYATRGSKARKIITILKDHFGILKKEWTCIDVGCGSGEITLALASTFFTTIGIESNFELLRENTQKNMIVGLNFILADGLHIPVADGSIDVIVCAQVYEHVPDPQKLVHEIWKKLKSGGVCFFSGPNKWSLIEDHYWLPFLSWMPKNIANVYMRLFKRGPEYDIRPMSYWKLRKMLQNFKIIDYSTKIIGDPHKYSMDESSRASAIIAHIPISLLRFFSPFLPNFNWILIKQ